MQSSLISECKTDMLDCIPKDRTLGREGVYVTEGRDLGDDNFVEARKNLPHPLFSLDEVYSTHVNPRDPGSYRAECTNVQGFLGRLVFQAHI